MQLRRQAARQSGEGFARRQASAMDLAAQSADVARAKTGQVAPEYIQLVAGLEQGALPSMLAHAAWEEGRACCVRRGALFSQQFLGMVEAGDEEDAAGHRRRASRLLPSSFARGLQDRLWLLC